MLLLSIVILQQYYYYLYNFLFCNVYVIRDYKYFHFTPKISPREILMAIS